MTTESSWTHLFGQWPDKSPRRGIVVTDFGEQIPFAGFMMKDEMLFLERSNPDALGARGIHVPLANVVAVKLIDPVQQGALEKQGYEGKLSSR